MKIMIFSDAWSPQINGVYTTLQNTIKELKMMNHLVEVIQPECFKYTVKYPTMKEIHIPLFPEKTIRKYISLFIDSQGPHAFHIATEGIIGWTARKILLEMNLLFTTSYHTDFPSYAKKQIGIPKTWTWKYLRNFHNKSAKILVSTDEISKELTKHGFNNIAHWTRGVDHNIFYCPELTDKPYVSTDININKKILMYGGRLSKEKNIEDFLNTSFPEFTYIIAGDGPYKKELEKFGKAKFLGMLSPQKLSDYMRLASVFVFPSKTDTFGLVMAEAACCGCPVAAYPVKGPINVIQHGITGWLDSNLNIAIKNALKLDRKKVAQTAQKQFSWKIATQQFLNNLIPAL
jgi:glycosyltransferase involved in cell wall biosynthesis